MNVFDYDAVIYDNDIYCIECLPDNVNVDDVDDNGDDICTPIFAGSEWDYIPVCHHCGTEHDYINLINYDQEGITED